MQELVRLSHDLGYQGVIIEVFNVYNLPIHFEIVICCLIYVCNQILVLKIHSEVFFIVVNF